MTSITTNERGAQRLSLEQLRKWEALKFGMFIHYGMSTYTGSELPDGSHPSTLYAPDKLDVDQWISVARDAGMKYAVLTTKHVAGEALRGRPRFPTCDQAGWKPDTCYSLRPPKPDCDFSGLEIKISLSPLDVSSDIFHIFDIDE
jgi:hypothetical protein